MAMKKNFGKTSIAVLVLTAMTCLAPFATKTHATVGCTFLCINSRFQDCVLVYQDAVVVCINGRERPPINP